MPRMTLRHLMLFVLYVAVILGLIMPAIRTPAENRGPLLIATALGVPLTMALLSAWILRPGPHRDWLTTFFLVIAQGTLGFFLAVAMVTGDLLPRHARDSSVSLIISLILFLLAMGSGFLVITLTQQFLIPRRCPCCTKAALFQAGLFADRIRRPGSTRPSLSMLEWIVYRDTQQFSFFVCDVCGSEAFLDHCRARQGCPACGRKSLYYLRHTRRGTRLPSVLRYTFFWCLCCKARRKQLLPDQWEDAASPEHDCEYWLWDSIPCLRALRHRIARMARF